MPTIFLQNQGNIIDSGSRPNRILIIDDDKDITLTFKTGLEEQGFEVDFYNNPITALSEYSPGRYDIMLVDIRMPLMNGFELYKEIRALDPKLKVCFITAFDINYEDFKAAFPTLALRHFIKKPIEIERLADELKSKIQEDYEIIG